METRGAYDPGGSWLDAECIYDPEDYGFIARRMSALASPHLPLRSLRVSFEDVAGHLTFMLDGKKFHWTVRLDNDWVDGSLFHTFARLLAARKSPKRFTYFNLDGQDCLVGCATPAEVTRLKEKAGVWLTSTVAHSHATASATGYPSRQPPIPAMTARSGGPMPITR